MSRGGCFCKSKEKHGEDGRSALRAGTNLKGIIMIVLLGGIRRGQRAIRARISVFFLSSSPFFFLESKFKCDRLNARGGLHKMCWLTRGEINGFRGKQSHF